MTGVRRLIAVGLVAILAVFGVGGFVGVAEAQPSPKADAAGRVAVPGEAVTVTPSPTKWGHTTTVSGAGCVANGGVPAAVHILIGTEWTFDAKPVANGTWQVVVKLEITSPTETFDVRASCDRYVDAFDYAETSLTITDGPTPWAGPAHPSLLQWFLVQEGGPDDGTFTFSGSGCFPKHAGSGAVVEIRLNDADGLEWAGRATVDQDGNWTMQGRTADLVGPGSYEREAVCSGVESSFVVRGSSTFLGAALVNYPGSVEQGGIVVVQVAEFGSRDEITMTLHSSPVVLATVIADVDGATQVALTIPRDTPAGEHAIVVVGDNGRGVRVPISVATAESTSSVIATPAATVPNAATVPTAGTVPTTATTFVAEPVESSTSAALADTGVSVAAMTVWAAALLIAGGLALLLTGRRGSGPAGRRRAN